MELLLILRIMKRLICNISSWPTRFPRMFFRYGSTLCITSFRLKLHVRQITMRFPKESVPPRVLGRICSVDNEWHSVPPSGCMITPHMGQGSPKESAFIVFQRSRFSRCATDWRTLLSIVQFISSTLCTTSIQNVSP